MPFSVNICECVLCILYKFDAFGIAHTIAVWLEHKILTFTIFGAILGMDKLAYLYAFYLDARI